MHLKKESLILYKAKKNKTSNRTRILECLFRNPTISRTEIADLTDITPATVTTTVTQLISEGIVQEAGESNAEDSTPGRRKILIEIIPDYAYSIGIEFTQKALVLCITNLKGTVITKNIVPFTEDLAKNITTEIITRLGQLIAASDISTNKFIGIGIAVPGHMDSDQKMMISNNRLWGSFSPDMIREAFDLPVVLENNVRCMGLSQYLFNPATTPDNFSFFHVGLGMHCAIIVEGELFSGNTYISGEIGHTIVDADGRRCECGKHGCLQTIASENWLLKIAGMLYENDSASLLKTLAASKNSITIDHITTAYEMGDAAIHGYISEALKALGITASNIAILTSPEKILLHGQLFNNKEIRRELMDLIQRQLLFVDSSYNNIFEILPCSTIDGAIGANALSVMHFFIHGISAES
ncbi:Sugar kinase of the NBD/HSP70 family, may contain an N-terminal HTH domain [Anaerobium acetethylicum]|uniref:Sugar kinase of the NBD/HSP70 family, may contain an N-terminal HTH domain n=1 Tax=Anaerobium acetethylicum TaxID=1619234 RepID=A0A1D3TU59_9FIRM|nr:Sugar kinase of the NBD/HSP70 family, may contain an N-terminal HTH domain [Anaerobium acetethylicum]